MVHPWEKEGRVSVSESREHRFTLLFQEYYEKVFRLSRRMCLDAVQAQDLAQEIFLKVYRKLDSFRGESSVSTWLYSIAVNHCLDHVRQEKKRRDLLALVGWKSKNTGAGVEGEVLSRHLGEKIMKRLSITNRTLLTLKVVMGFDYREIGKIMDMTPDSVGVQLTRARRAAATIAKEEGYTHEM